MSLKKDLNEKSSINPKLDSNLISNEKNSKFAKLIDEIHNNNLEDIYSKDSSEFIDKINKLNLQFYIETENYLNNKGDKEKCQNKLFIILFRQLNLYISEIEKLNKFIKGNLLLINNNNKKPSIKYFNVHNKNNLSENKNEENFIIGSALRNSNKQNDSHNDTENSKKEDEVMIEIKKINVNNLSLDELKTKYKILEKKLIEKITNEKKLNFEINNLKRQLNFYNEKLRIDIDLNKTSLDNNAYLRNTTNFNFSKKNFLDQLETRNNPHDSVDINFNKTPFPQPNVEVYKSYDIININNNTYNSFSTNKNNLEQEYSANNDIKFDIGKSDKSGKTIFSSIINDNLNILNQNINNVNNIHDDNNNFTFNAKNKNTTHENPSSISNSNNQAISTSSSTKNISQQMKSNNPTNINNLTKPQIIDGYNPKTKPNSQQSATSILKIEKVSNIASNNNINPKAISKKRNFSDNNPHNTKQNPREGKVDMTKTINLNARYSFVESKQQTKNLSPKHLLDAYNSNINKNISNPLNNANTLIKNPLSYSLNEVKFSSFNKNIKDNSSRNINNSSRLISGKDLKITNAIKQSMSRDKESKRSREIKSHSENKKLYNFDFSNMKISNQQETKELQDLIIKNFNYFEDEYFEIENLEYQLQYLKEGLSLYDYVLKPESLELCKKSNFILSDLEDDYKSAYSSLSEKNEDYSNFGFKNNQNNPSRPLLNTLKERNNNKFPISTSITINLN